MNTGKVPSGNANTGRKNEFETPFQSLEELGINDVGQVAGIRSALAVQNAVDFQEHDFHEPTSPSSKSQQTYQLEVHRGQALDQMAAVLADTLARIRHGQPSDAEVNAEGLKALHQLALDQDSTAQVLSIEVLNDLFRKYGRRPVAKGPRPRW
jgi:hypothetical protein